MGGSAILIQGEILHTTLAVASVLQPMHWHVCDTATVALLPCCVCHHCCCATLNHPSQDDGGHQNDQIYNSFATLFHKALKPGGVYFIEDLHVARTAKWRGRPGTPIMPDVITDWVESILAATTFGSPRKLVKPEGMRLAKAYHQATRASMLHTGDNSYLPVWKLPGGVKMLECAAEMCVLVKCTDDDDFCPDGMVRVEQDGVQVSVEV